MTPEELRRVLAAVAGGGTTVEDAARRLSRLPVEALGGENGAAAWARLDHHRGIRVGMPEVVFAQGKTTEQVVALCARLAETDTGFLATRVDDPTRAALAERFPSADINDLGRTAWLAGPHTPPTGAGTVLIVSAGTADLPVAEEAAVTAAAFGNPVERLYDVGVAGLHRLLAHQDTLSAAAVVIVVAGMEGALPSVVGGLVATPLVAVPTSVGYGAAFGGLAALLSMLNSCAAGITVVNIDNGFGAACAATRINGVRSRAS